MKFRHLIQRSWIILSLSITLFTSTSADSNGSRTGQAGVAWSNPSGWPGAPADVMLVSKWATYVGGLSSQGEQYLSATADTEGNVYLLANTEAPAVPSAKNARIPQGTAWAVYAAKISASGLIAWTRWVGGYPASADIVHDGLGNVYVVSQSGNPEQVDGLDQTGAGAYVVKLTAEDGDLQWAKFIAPTPWNWWEGAREVAITKDTAGQIYVVAETTANIFPNPVHSRPANEPDAGPTTDVVVVKMSSTGQVSWASYFGGRGADFPADVAVDDSGNVYVVGRAQWSLEPSGASYNLPNVRNTWQGGDHDGFVTKLDRSGNVLWSRLFGGESFDQALSLSLAGDDVYVGGMTMSLDMDPVPTNTLPAQDEHNALFCKLTSNGDGLWATYVSESGRWHYGVAMVPGKDGIMWTSSGASFLESLDMGTGEWLNWHSLSWIHPPFRGDVRSLLAGPEGEIYAVGTIATDLTTATNGRNQDAGDPFVNRLRFVPCDDGFEPNDSAAQALDWGGNEASGSKVYRRQTKIGMRSK